MSDKLIGTSTDFYYIWDDEIGWIHISEKEKLAKAYENFLVSGRRMGMTSTPLREADYFMEIWNKSHSSKPTIRKEDEE